MPESKELELREGYQDPAQRIGFNPISVPDASGAMKENRAVAMANMQREDEALTKAETAALEWAKQGNAQQAAELAAFSESLSSLAKLGVQEYWKAEAKKGINRVRESGVTPEEYLEYHQSLNGMKTAQAGGDAIANQSLAAGEPYEVANVWKGLSGISQVYAKQEIARQAGAAYGGWMEQQLSTNNSMVLRTKDGEEFTPASTGSDPAKRAMAIRALDDVFYEQFGLLGVNRVLLQDHAFKQMNEDRAKLIGLSRQNYAISQSYQAAEMAKGQLKADGNILNFVRSMSSTVDERGNHRNLGGAWKAAWDYLTELDTSGELTEDLYQRIRGTVDPDTGKPAGERWKTQFLKFDKERAERNRKDYADMEADKKLAFQQAEQMALRDLQENGGTEADVANVQAALFSKYGYKSEALSTFASTYSIDAVQRQELDRKYKNLAENGMLTPEQVARAPWELQQKWGKVAEGQGQIFGGNKFKDQSKGLEGLVRNTPQVRSSPHGFTGLNATLVIGDLQSKFRRKVAEYAGRLEPEEAIKQAVAEVQLEFQQGITNPSSKYFVDNTGDFVNFLPSSNITAARAKALHATDNKIRSALTRSGRKGLDTPELIWTKEDLEAMDRGYGEPGWRLPSTAQRWASELNISPLEIINRQRKAIGLDELATPKAIEEAKGTISPRLQGLINRFPSPNRSVRALSSSGAYNPTFVPKGYGDVISKAAQTHGIDPGILAGLIETESSWDPNAVSKAGAQGIAQIMPEYHPDVDTSNPQASIEYAAKYLSSLQRQFGGDMRLALIAYNAGPGNVEKHNGPIPGNAESQGYYGKVLKAAAKYGYGQAWSDPTMVRSKFRPIEHLSGDKSHGSYRADHGGSNYHEHLAFNTPEEARAAAAKLKAAGIKITELKGEGPVGTHSKNSYHYSGMAFDVPADQVSPGEEQELSRRVRSILGIS